eukprot:24784-Rhodomonas_salina.2
MSQEAQRELKSELTRLKKVWEEDRAQLAQTKVLPTPYIVQSTTCPLNLDPTQQKQARSAALDTQLEDGGSVPTCAWMYSEVQSIAVASAFKL